ncbi:hypothetical protein Gorai_014642 [Gossypium raimondii]|uniref:Uncharacterized protein n=1 Tax=Gossypium raimondii TaxID=29730 RepID=A0A7J8P3S4_GOSRA|nr:hypothetical protein [Gossypium raimondii]
MPTPGTGNHSRITAKTVTTFLTT